MNLPSGAHAQQDDIELISSSITLPNGVVVPNRLVKAAMEEGIGNGGSLPGANHQRLYRRWAKGGWGIIMTGNVQVDPRHLATPHDLTVSSNPSRTLSAYSALADSIRSSVPSVATPPLLIMQISHAGLQSSPTNLSRPPWVAAVAPTSARPNTGDGVFAWIVGRVMWPMKSRTIVDVGEWLGIVENFVKTAKMAEEAGWDGVEVHSAHGYLLAEYLSPLTNPNPVALPSVPEHIPIHLHLLYLILIGIQDVTERKFIKAVKVNCSDFVQGGKFFIVCLDEERAADVVKEIVSWKLVDMLEISGGNYSNPAFASLEAVTAHPTRQSLFSHFTTNLLPSLSPPPTGPAIILTGGLHSRTLIASSLRTRACDLIGIGRPAAVKPELPNEVVLNRELEEGKAIIGGYGIPGGERLKQMLGGGKSHTPDITPTVEGSHLEAADANSESTTEVTPLLSTKASATDTQKKNRGVPLVGAGVSTFWHEWQLCRIGRGLEPDLEMSWLWGGLVVEGIWWGMLGGGPLGWFKGSKE
ncbi:hypothetical protein HWV62_16054 [Athelia sp. TMB]|nr:hypothetical protein HWV62_16054 [Athelia sp. TMB]